MSRVPAPRPSTPGRRLRRWRQDRDLTQEQLGGLIGCGVAMVSYLERDQRRPGRETGRKIVKVTGVNFGLAIGGEV